MKFLKFSRKQTERGYEILKFLGARRFSLRTATRFLNFTPASHNGFRILKFTPAPLRNRFEILKFTLALARLANIAQNFISRNGFKILKLICSLLFALRRVLPSADKAEAGRAARLTSQHTHDATEKRRAVKINHAGGYSNFVYRRIALRSAAARHGYEVGRAEKLSKFDLTGALLNFISLLSRKFKLALLKFTPEPLRNRSEILNFTPKLRKFKSAPAVRLNFALNSIPHARAAKFEHAAKFKRGAR